MFRGTERGEGAEKHYAQNDSSIAESPEHLESSTPVSSTRRSSQREKKDDE